jgi:hypothetical protein
MLKLDFLKGTTTRPKGKYINKNWDVEREGNKEVSARFFSFSFLFFFFFLALLRSYTLSHSTSRLFL